MRDLDAIHAAILAEPGAELHRLAYADCLEDRGEPGDAGLAEFIRLQLELDKLRATVGSHLSRAAPPAGCECGTCRMRRREDALLSAYRRHWAQPLRDIIHPGEARVHFQGGFIYSIELPTNCWIAHGDALAAAFPIRAVKLDDRRPQPYPAGEDVEARDDPDNRRARLTMTVAGKRYVWAFDEGDYGDNISVAVQGFRMWAIGRRWPGIVFSRGDGW